MHQWGAGERGGWYSTVQYSKVHNSTIQYITVQYSTVQYSIEDDGPRVVVSVQSKSHLLDPGVAAYFR